MSEVATPVRGSPLSPEDDDEDEVEVRCVNHGGTRLKSQNSENDGTPVVESAYTMPTHQAHTLPIAGFFQRPCYVTGGGGDVCPAGDARSCRQREYGQRSAVKPNVAHGQDESSKSCEPVQEAPQSARDGSS